MISRFKSINNLAVFNDFKWDSFVKAKNGVVQYLKQINILYGRNYSGKTTLSRIVEQNRLSAMTFKSFNLKLLNNC